MLAKFDLSCNFLPNTFCNVIKLSPALSKTAQLLVTSKFAFDYWVFDFNIYYILYTVSDIAINLTKNVVVVTFNINALICYGL